MRTLLLAIAGLASLAGMAGAQGQWEWIGPSGLYIEEMVVDGDGAIFIGGNYTNMHVTEDEGLTWTELLNGPPRLVEAVATPAGTLVCSDAWADGLWVTADKGTTWTRVTVHQPEEYVAHLAVHPQTAAVFASVQFDNIFYSQDGGYTWQPVAAPLACIDYFDLAAGGNGSVWVKGDGNLWRSDDYGASWSDLAMPPECAYGGGLFVSPGPVLFLWGGGPPNYFHHLLRSTDLGATWEPLDEGLPALPYRDFTEMEDGSDGALLLGDMSRGIYRSTDMGGTWELYTDGLSSTDITCLADRPGGGHYAASLYEGVFRNAHGVDAVPETPGAPDGVRLAASPNPCRGSMDLDFALPAPGPVSMSLLDAQGRLVRTLVAADLGAGEHRLRLDAHEVACGAYYLRLSALGEQRGARIVFLR